MEYTPEERARILENAARALETRGWIEGACIKDGGAMCAVGAIGYAAGWDEADIEIEVKDGYGDLYDFAHDIFDIDMTRFSINGYNDSHQKEDVTRLLRDRAKQVRDGLSFRVAAPTDQGV